MEAKQTTGLTPNGKKRGYTSTLPQLREKAPATPYGLRGESKVPMRYRELDFEDPPRSPRRTPGKRSPRKLAQLNQVVVPTNSARRSLIHMDTIAKADSTEDVNVNIMDDDLGDFLETSATPSYTVMQPMMSAYNLMPHSNSNSSMSASHSQPSQARASSEIDFSNELYEEVNYQTQTGSQTPQYQNSMVHAIGVNASRKPPPTKADKEREELEERIGVKKLKHMLSLQKARRWAICEFFYSTIDHQLFHADNEFQLVLHESFPNLKTNMLTKTEWRTIRRLLGKPRRCSPMFFMEERDALTQKRAKIRAIYEGTFFTQRECDCSDLPATLPRSLAVGMRVHARIHTPKDGVYGGTIDAVLKDSYRVIFDMEEMIPPLVIADSQVMIDGELELMPISYFIEQATAKLPPHAQRLMSQSTVITSPMPMGARPMSESAAGRAVRRLPFEQHAYGGIIDNEKVGNYPVRQLVILVKLSKLIDQKKRLVRQLSELNAEAEKANLLTDVYQPAFQEKYAQVVVDLDTLNKQISSYMSGVQEYTNVLAQQISDSSTLRPEQVRRSCTAHANQIVRAQNEHVHLPHARVLSLITSLTSLLLQIRALGEHKITPIDLQMLGDSITEIRSMISPRNTAHFQDNVEVHMKQVHNLMMQVSSLQI